MEVLILIIVLAIVVIGGGVAAFMHGRGTTTIEPPARPAPTKAPPRPKTEVDEGDVAVVEPEVVEPEPEPEPEPATFRDRLAKARGALAGYFGSILSRGVDAETWDELEELLIKADVGVPVTMSVLDELREEAKADNITESAELLDRLKAKMKDRLSGHDLSLAGGGDPSIWLFVGVNGVGKTTTIGKLAKREGASGRDVVLAAGDTFRAAAAEQLEMWAERADAAIVRFRRTVMEAAQALADGTEPEAPQLHDYYKTRPGSWFAAEGVPFAGALGPRREERVEDPRAQLIRQCIVRVHDAIGQDGPQAAVFMQGLNKAREIRGFARGLTQ